MFDDPSFFRDLLENLYDGIYFVDCNRTITYWNKGAEAITGYAARDVIGKRCQDNILNHVTENGLELCKEHCPMSATMNDGKRREAEVYLHHADGHRVPVLVRAAPIRNRDGEVIGAVETFSDNTPRLVMRKKNLELQKTISVDALTGVGNRRHIEMRARAELSVFQESHDSFGVLFCDIDHFKNVNDAFGHAAGDKALRMVASTLRGSLRARDTIGRWGGEEFVILVGDVNGAGLEVVAKKLCMLVEQSHLEIDAQVLRVTISIGATMVEEMDTVETLMQRADRLMYASKSSGRNRVTVG